MESRREPYPRRSRQRSDDPLDRRLDQWLETGRQLVDGVAGTRPGSRGSAGRGGSRSTAASLDAVGRWVGDKIDWLLDEEDDWGGSWESPRSPQAMRPRESMRTQFSSPQDVSVGRPAAQSAKRPLEAISRRQPPLMRPAEPQQRPLVPPVQASPTSVDVPVDDEGWPDDDSFRLDRWQRSPESAKSQPKSARGSAAPASTPQPAGGRRPLPRSSRRRA